MTFGHYSTKTTYDMRPRDHMTPPQTWRKPKLSKMNILELACYIYKHLKKMLNPRYKKGIFVGYGMDRPSYLVYYPENRENRKHRQVKFVTNIIDQ